MLHDMLRVLSRLFQLQPTRSVNLFARSPTSCYVNRRQVHLSACRSTEGHWSGPGEDHEEYRQFNSDRVAVAKKLLESPTRFQRISKREDRSDTPVEAVVAHGKGKWLTLHRGASMMKCAEDLVICNQLLWYLRPATLIELGTNTGGTTVWMADMLKLMDVECQIYSMDIDLSLIEDQVKKIKPANVTFLQGDSNKIEETFTPEFLRNTQHPWIVMDDAHENMYGVMTYFHQFMQPGDYFVMEDTNPDAPGKIGLGTVYPDLEYHGWGPDKLNELKKFLTDYDSFYAVDTFFTDFYGYNGTSNWHGYIRRMQNS